MSRESSARTKKPNGTIPTSPLANSQCRPPPSVTPDSSISSLSSSSTGEVSSREASATASPTPPTMDTAPPAPSAAPEDPVAHAETPVEPTEPPLGPLKPSGSAEPQVTPETLNGEDSSRSGEHLLAGGESQYLSDQTSSNGWSAQICMSGIAFCFKVVYCLQFLVKSWAPRLH